MTEPILQVGDKVRRPAPRGDVPDLIGSVRAVFWKLDGQRYVLVELTDFNCGALRIYRPEELEIDHDAA